MGINKQREYEHDAVTSLRKHEIKIANVSVASDSLQRTVEYLSAQTELCNPEQITFYFYFFF